MNKYKCEVCGNNLVEIKYAMDDKFNPNYLFKTENLIWRTYKCPRELNANRIIRPFIIHSTFHVLVKDKEHARF
jgi:hypothetical protein